MIKQDTTIALQNVQAVLLRDSPYSHARECWARYPTRYLKPITLLGAGLIGSLAAVYLTKQGYTVTIYERRSDMRKETISAGRSINLALSDKGWRGLAGAGVDTLIRDNAIPMYSRHIHNLDGSEINQAYGKENQAIYSISRRDINCLLMDAAEENGAKIFFNHRVTNYDINNNIITIEDATNKKTFQISPGLTIGSDGAFSSSRLGIQFTDRCNYTQTYLEHGYKEAASTACMLAAASTSTSAARARSSFRWRLQRVRTYLSPESRRAPVRRTASTCTV